MSQTERSLAVLKRSVLKLGFFTVAAGIETSLGYHFVFTLATLCSLTSLLSVLLGCLFHEKIASPHYTFFDESAWFALLGHVLRFA